MKITIITQLLLICLLAGCTITTKTKFNTALDKQYQLGYSDAKQVIERNVIVKQVVKEKPTYVFTSSDSRSRIIKNNVKLMSLSSLVRLFESKEDIIIVKSIQLDQNIPGFHNEAIENEIAQIRSEQDEIMLEIQKRQEKK